MSSSGVSPGHEVAWRLGLVVYLFGLLVFLVDVEEALGNSDSAGVILVSGIIGLIFMLVGSFVGSGGPGDRSLLRSEGSSVGE